MSRDGDRSGSCLWTSTCLTERELMMAEQVLVHACCMSQSSYQYPSRGIRTEGSALSVPLRMEPNPRQLVRLMEDCQLFSSHLFPGQSKLHPGSRTHPLVRGMDKITSHFTGTDPSIPSALQNVPWPEVCPCPLRRFPASFQSGVL